MDVSWGHGVATGILISALLGIGLIYNDVKHQNSEIRIGQNINQIETTQEPEVKSIDLPFGGRELLPNYRFVALYGVANTQG